MVARRKRQLSVNDTAWRIDHPKPRYRRRRWHDLDGDTSIANHAFYISAVGTSAMCVPRTYSSASRARCSGIGNVVPSSYWMFAQRS